MLTLVHIFFFAKVPHYLRTKPDPEVEARHTAYAQRAGIPSPEVVNKMISGNMSIYFLTFK